MKGISPFEYNKIVTGEQFIGREKEVETLKGLILNKKNVLLYGPPKIGKRSIVFNALSQLQKENDHDNFLICTINLFNIRSIESLLLKINQSVLTLFSDDTQHRLKKNYLNKIFKKIDSEENFSEKQIKQLLKFPDWCCENTHTKIIIYFQQFQDILLFEKSLRALSLLEEQFAHSQQVSYIIVGDKRNAMDYIFQQMNFFRNLVTNISILPIQKRKFSQYIAAQFVKNGKSASLKEVDYIYELMDGDPWYIQHLSEICFLKCENKLTHEIVNESVVNLIAIHDYELHNTVYGLSNHQLLMLKAILDGERHFSKVENIRKYHLNSSANVNRVREALIKKEIVTFINKHKIEFNDSLLKYWLTNYFFDK